MRRLLLPSCAIALPLLILATIAGEATAGVYEENFSTEDYCDTGATTALWDTLAGELRLHDFEMSVIGTPATPTYTLGVALDGDYAYVSCHTAGLQVIDISDPSNPVVLGTCGTPSSSFKVDVAGDVAYVADTWGGLRVIDVSDPTNPTEVGSYEPGELFDVAVAGDHAYVVVRNHGLVVLDVSDPANPVPVGFCPAPGGVTGIDVAGNHAYVACSYDAEIWIADISDPANPFPVGSYDAPGVYCSDLVVAGDHLYTALRPAGLLVLDISDPTDPTFEGFCATPDYASMLDVDGDYAYVTAGGTGGAGGPSKLYQIDVSDPSSPTLENTCPLPAHDGGSVAVAGEYAFVANLEQGLQIVRIAEPTTPRIAGSANTPGLAHWVQVAGDHAFIADYLQGFHVVDISDPANPTIAGGVDTPGHAHHVELAGDYAYVADAGSGIQVIDISNPAAPTIVGSEPPVNSALASAAVGNRLYVAEGSAGLRVFDITSPPDPVPIGSFSTADYANDVAVAGDVAYVTVRYAGLQAIDISNPASPVHLGIVDTPDYAYGIALAGDHVYIADGASGLQVVDVSDPANPAIVGSVDTPVWARGMTVAGDYAYLSDGSITLHVIDISDPTNPTILWNVPMPSSPLQVAIAGDYGYVMAKSDGLQTVELYQREYDAGRNVGQSLALDVSDDTIERAHIVATHTDSVRWELSADGGSNWEELLPTGLWHTFASPGTDLLWRSNLTYVGGGRANPTVSDLAVVWSSNIVCDPDPEYLTVAEPTKTVDVNYLGGGGGGGGALLYGYSIKLTWDGAIVGTSTASVTEGTLLSNEGTTFFFAADSGTNEIIVDCALLGDEPGVAGPGTLFSVEFTGLALGTSDIDITILEVRDWDNNPLSGFYEDDGLLVVDLSPPTVADVLIWNDTLGHTDDYIKNTDTARVTATVLDDDPAFGIGNITADLQGLGGGATDPPTTYNALTGAAVWTITITSVTCLPLNGTVTVMVSAADPIGNPATPSSDTIIADNLAPTAVLDFDAAPGHEKCNLSWTLGTDLYLDGTVIQRNDNAAEYPTYPLFVGAWPAVDAYYPPDHLSGTNAFAGAGATTADVVVPRNIYYYQAFHYDIARNYGIAATTARDLATNYWLGDVTTTLGFWDGYNGLVNDADVDKLGGTYRVTAPGPPDDQCDVGPTVHPDNNRLGLPLPDAWVEFEDLMIFAMNYGRVSPRVVPFLPEESTKALSLELAEVGVTDDGVLEVALRLEGNASEVKGLSTAIVYDSAELEFISARLSDDMSSPLAPVFFWHGSDGSNVQLDLAVLGTDVTVGGSGEVAVMRFRALGDEYSLVFDSARIRSADNGELSAVLDGCESRPEYPTAFRLVQNSPNPFNPVTKVAYDMPRAASVAIRVYDVTGRLVRTLVDCEVEPGRHAAVWDGTNDTGERVASGVYLCTMEAGEFRGSRKMLLLK